MLKHNPTLRKLWNKAPKIKSGSFVSLDKRYKATKDFEKALQEYLVKNVKFIPEIPKDILN